MFETIKNAWKLPDLKKRICFTLLIIVVFRFGAALPVPFLDASVMQGFGDGNLLGFLNMLTGGAFQNATLFALSISPYITASIVVRAVLEVVGIKDIRTKCLRSNNPTNVVNATVRGLAALRNAEEVAAIRGKTVKEILG